MNARESLKSPVLVPEQVLEWNETDCTLIAVSPEVLVDSWTREDDATSDFHPTTIYAITVTKI